MLAQCPSNSDYPIQTGVHRDEIFSYLKAHNIGESYKNFPFHFEQIVRLLKSKFDIVKPCKSEYRSKEPMKRGIVHGTFSETLTLSGKDPLHLVK
jgi:hypothetical protein